jgi:hypothetical protein
MDKLTMGVRVDGVSQNHSGVTCLADSAFPKRSKAMFTSGISLSEFENSSSMHVMEFCLFWYWHPLRWHINVHERVLLCDREGPSLKSTWKIKKVLRAGGLLGNFSTTNSGAILWPITIGVLAVFLVGRVKNFFFLIGIFSGGGIIVNVV